MPDNNWADSEAQPLRGFARVPFAVMPTKNSKLARLLKLSLRSPSLRPDFYRLLLKSDLLLLCQPEFDTSQGGSGKKSQTFTDLSILEWRGRSGQKIIPLFSSPKSVQLGLKNADVLWLNAKQIFKSLGNSWFVLDPFSEVNKEFTPYEVTQLLNGELTKRTKVVKALKLSSFGSFKLKPVRKPNKALLKDLVDVCRDSRTVEKAYIASISYKKSRKVPILCILLRCNGENKLLYSDLSLTALDHFPPKRAQFIDVIPLSADQDREMPKLGIKPFFRRSKA